MDSTSPFINWMTTPPSSNIPSHAQICCDTPASAQASTSQTTPDLSHRSSRISSPSDEVERDDKSKLEEMEMFCCGDEWCDGEEAVECCDQAGCTEGEIGGSEGAGPGTKEETELHEWACSKEGCKAIQQYLDCCAQAECALPPIPDPPPDPSSINGLPPNLQPLPPAQSVLTQFHYPHHPHIHSHHHHHSIPHPSTIHPQPDLDMLFQPQTQPLQPAFPGWTSLGSLQQPQQLAPILPIHICHWQNCHLTFNSMPDLLGHVAADHLGAPGFTAPPPTAVLPQVPSFSSTTSIMTSNPNGNQLMGGQLTYIPTEADQLLSCLWDDCFPLPECTAPTPETCPTHSHMPAHPIVTAHSQSQQLPTSGAPPTHLSGSGEPFSPQTMLRHVLEEHLGVPGEIIGWGENDPPPILPPTSNDSVVQAHTKLHNNHHVHNHQHVHGHGHHHHHHNHHHHLLTPPNSNTSPSIPPSPAIQAGSILPTRCLWSHCQDRSNEFTPEELMKHLTTQHVPLKSALKASSSELDANGNSHICLWDDCTRGFTSRQKLVRHLQSHIGYKPFLCHICGVGFGEAVPLAAHLRRHAKEKPFKCEYPGCGKEFAIASSLTIHMRTHNGEKPFICPYCDKGFVEASNLTKHIRTHTGEKPFACGFPGCGKRFPRPDQLKRHMGVHDSGKEKGDRGSKKGKKEIV